ncbi:MAG: lysogenization regulator HflD [Porticoccus sp.]|jgi:high frequency lysogenization protein|nr:lysogenization regulator HflD [Porticoccus sp.]|tara:strand:+ start:1723 stop:2352 length:630 start_codon:yes stop_codon:yes gene_type:complete
MIFKKPTRNQIIALSGIFQSCHLVHQLSRYGSITEEELKSNIQVLFSQGEKEILNIYGSIENLDHGINFFQSLLVNKYKRNLPETLRYAIGVMYLAKKLRKDKKMSMMIKHRLELSVRQIEHFSLTHPNVISNISQIYQDSFGTFLYRMKINGSFEYLKQDQVVYRIRCLLFSGIRSALLFHQTGGKKRQLIFNKTHILEQLKNLHVDI